MRLVLLMTAANQHCRHAGSGLRLHQGCSEAGQGICPHPKTVLFYRVIWVIFLLPEGTIIAHTWLNFILQKLLIIANDIAGYNAGRLIMSSKVFEFIFKPKPIVQILKLFSCYCYS